MEREIGSYVEEIKEFITLTLSSFLDMEARKSGSLVYSWWYIWHKETDISDTYPVLYSCVYVCVCMCLVLFI